MSWIRGLADPGQLAKIRKDTSGGEGSSLQCFQVLQGCLPYLPPSSLAHACSSVVALAFTMSLRIRNSEGEPHWSATCPSCANLLSRNSAATSPAREVIMLQSMESLTRAAQSVNLSQNCCRMLVVTEHNSGSIQRNCSRI